MEAYTDTDHGPQMEDQYYVRNAGIVLLHPFLPTFAAEANLTGKNGDFKTESCRARLVYLLQYLATGREEIAQTDLALNKTLCGIHLDATLQCDMAVTTHEKEMAESLLTAVIAHWNKLAHTSIAGFRDSFLLRDGLIIMTDDSVVLKVEKRAFDILLNDVPWNISVIKTPWMPHILQVDW